MKARLRCKICLARLYSTRPEPKSPSEALYGRISAMSALAMRTGGILNGKVSDASSAFNEMTGYATVERIKEAVESRENELLKARDNLVISKKAYEEAIETRASSQREVNSLLQRKHEWTEEDVGRFTSLYRSDHENEARERNARLALADAEASVENGYAELSKAILARYHEEQIWSDKIRRAGTFGSWGLMGINVLLFIVVQTIVEPRKRQRLADTFQEAMLEKTDEDRQRMRVEFFDPVVKQLNSQEERINQHLTKEEVEAKVEQSTDISLQSAAIGAAAGAAFMTLFFWR